MAIYKYSYRFNAMHDTSSSQDDKHTHSFEAVFYVKQDVQRFYVTEKIISDYMVKYRGNLLNEIMEERPTIENIAEKIYREIDNIKVGFDLIRLEMSDSPVQSYIIGEEEI